MDMSLVAGILSAQTGNLQTQIATSILKSSVDAEKSAVLTLLGQGGPSTANLGPGIGGNLDITA
jgi:Putative motility protein